MYIVAFILGGVLAVFLLSTLVGFVAFRKVDPPKKQLFSVTVAFVIASILGAYGLADGDEPKFLQSIIQYGIASILLLAIQMAVFFVKRKSS